MAIVEVSIVPIGVPTSSLSPYVAKAVQVLRESRLEYELTAMGTIISGDLKEVLAVIETMHESCFGPDVGRVLTTLRIDDRRDKRASSKQKIDSVLAKLPEGK